MTPTLKANMETLPARMRDLPVDERGYVVPWFVDWIDGKPEFRAMDRLKFIRAIREKLCWVCGERLGVHFTFVAGPMCGINRTNSEPPNHRDCAMWSAQNCPFLSNPRMVRREEGLTPEVLDSAAGHGLKRNPGVTMLWHTRNYEVFDVGKMFHGKANGEYLITMGEPESVDWMTCGRPSTRAEVVESIESGIPNLEAVARLDKGGLQALAQARARFEKWIPA
jgi:hypothetical protein